MTNYSSIRYQPAAASTTTVADIAALIALAGMSNGDQALVQATNKLYMYSGTGWYLIATIQNDAPSAITGVNGTYELAIDGTATTITAVSTDPEGFPLTWSYSTSGLGSIATVSHSDGVFTITPSTTEADAGTFTLTINATDGVNGAVSTSTNLTLEFMVIVTNSKYTTLLATAVDTSDNNNITDASSNNHSITVNGDAHAGTFSPYRSGGYSTYFDGSSSLTIPNDATLYFGSGDYTVETWVYNTDTGNDIKWIAGIWHYTIPAAQAWGLFHVNGQYNFIVDPADTTVTIGTSGLHTNEWTHLAVTKSGNVFRMFINGVQESTTTLSHTMQNGSGAFDIGAAGSGPVNTRFGGYISNLRVVKGTAVYTSNFTPPTEPLTAITNTTLLTCHLPYIADGSTNDHAITVTGNVSTKPLTPFDNLEYSEALHGGSVYFDGSGDFLTTTMPVLGTGSFTVEFWFYPTDPTRAYLLLDKDFRDGNFSLQTDYLNTGLFYLSVAGSAYTFSFTPPIVNQWNHIAISRNSSSLRFFLNGVQLGTTSTNSGSVTTGTLYIGGASAATAGYLTTMGYISDVRIIEGSALYTGNFTPPTETLTAITNTSLLLNGTDASIIDKAQTSNLQLVGNTTGSTTQVKFAGSKSMYFDGTGDYLAVSSSSTDYDLPADFTIEAWIYPTVLSGDHIIVDTYNSSQAGSYQLYWRSSGNSLVFYSEGDGWLLTDPSSSSISVNTWNHVAVSRSGTSAKMFVNGTVVDTATNSRELRAGFPVAIGYQRVSGSLYFAGYIQDVRISNGLARYTANFTPPTSSLEG